MRVRFGVRVRLRLEELLLAHRAVAVVVPVAKQVDDAHGVIDEDLAQLLLHSVRGRGRGRVRVRVRVWVLVLVLVLVLVRVRGRVLG